MLNKLFSIKSINAGSHVEYRVFGIKIRIKPFNISKQNFVSEAISREVTSALDVIELHRKTFPQFKTINKDNEVAIFGCGPTIQYYNNELNTKNIALNKALFLDNIHFDYSFTQDSNILKTCPGYLDKIKEKDCVKFIGKFLQPEYCFQMPEIATEKEDNILRYYTNARNWLPAKDLQYHLFPNLESRPLADFSSVSFAALHFALYTHPKKIYLIGLDTSSGGQNFFDKCNGNYDTKHMIEGYKLMKKFASVYYPDVEIISVNPVGLRGLFKDIYTKSYVDNNIELQNKNIEII